MTHMLRLTGLLSLSIICAAAPPAAPDGQTLFQQHCSLCHKADAANRTPTLEALKWVPTVQL